MTSITVVTQTVTTVAWVFVACPFCSRRQSIRVPKGTPVDGRCHRCGARWQGTA